MPNITLFRGICAHSKRLLVHIRACTSSTSSQTPNDADVFGTYRASTPLELKSTEVGDIKQDQHDEDQPTRRQQLSVKRYADEIKALISKHKIKEALDMLECRILKRDRVKPPNYLFNLLIGACGRVGYTKKAFMLFNQMKKRGLQPTNGTYTALFNACANSPWPKTDGLTRAKHLLELVHTKGVVLNDSNYHAIMKAFGRAGDQAMVHKVVQDMCDQHIALTTGTINFMLQACITDKETGFKSALSVWRNMLKMRIKPDTFTFNLMLRTARDCGLGLTTMDEGMDLSTVLLEGHTELPTDETLLPDLLARTPKLGALQTIKKGQLDRPEDRLLLMGGMRTFFDTMQKYEATPNIKTITVMLDCLPNNIDSEQDLLNYAKKAGHLLDTDFYNMLIKKRCMRKDYEGAKAVLKLMRKSGRRPDLITYGVLSLTCKSQDDAVQLVNEMVDKGYRLNAEILGAMLRQACHHRNFNYILHIMETALMERVTINAKFLEHLEMFKKECKHLEKNKHDVTSKTKVFRTGYFRFRQRLKTWLDEIEVDRSNEAHPWLQYRQASDTDVKNYRDRNAKSRFPARQNSKFRVKTTVTKGVLFSKNRDRKASRSRSNEPETSTE